MMFTIVILTGVWFLTFILYIFQAF